VEPVIAEFVPDVQGYQDKTGYPDEESGQGDQGISLLLLYVAEGALEIILKHRCLQYRDFILLIIEVHLERVDLNLLYRF